MRYTKVLTILVLFLALSPAAGARDNGPAKAGQDGPAKAGQDGPAKAGQDGPAKAGKLVIIYFEDAPLVKYAGGLDGLEATSPSARGEGRLDARSPASRAYLEHLDRRHKAYVKALSHDLGREVRPVFRYRSVRNGIAVALSAKELATVRRLPGVVAVVPDALYSVRSDRGPTWIGAPTIWDGSANGTTTQGEGTVLAVIDTGINMDHPSFAATGDDGFTHTNPNGAGNYLGWCDPSHPDYDPAYPCNDKLIGAWDYMDAYCAANPNICSEQDGPEGSHFHGSHTAGTAAGNVLFSPRVSGVAPHANIISYDACLTAFLDQCAFSTISAAIDQAVLDGVDVISLALEGGSRPWQVDDVDNVLLGAVDAGVFVAASAGPLTIPTSIDHHGPWVTTVTASSHDRAGVANQLVDAAGGGSPPADLDGQSRTLGYGPAPIVYAGNYANGDANPELCESAFPPGTWTDEIVVCDRPGTLSRLQVCANAQAGGAAGCVLANREAGQSDPVADLHILPAIHVNLADGNALRAWLASGSGHTATITDSVVQGDPALGDIMIGTSPAGPNRSFDSLKPDVTAPGVGIFAATINSSSGFPEFVTVSGSSMACSTAAGAALLLRALHPGWTPSEVKSALMLSSDLTVTFDGAAPADSFSRGAGRINLEQAARVGLVMDETTANYLAANPEDGGDPTTLNTASAQIQCYGRCTVSRTFRSVADQSVTWNVGQLVTRGGASITAQPSSFTLAPGASQTVDFTADVIGQPLDMWIHERAKLSPQGTRGILPDDLHLPIVVRPGAENLPELLHLETLSSVGTFTIDGLHSALEITDLQLTVSGLDEGAAIDIELPQDPTNNNPYDNLDDVHVKVVNVAAGARLLFAATDSENVRDVDLYVGTGSTPSSGTQICESVDPVAQESCEIHNPAAGQYWILVQTFTGATGEPDLIDIRDGVITDDVGNLTVTGPTTVAIGDPFDITLEWNEPDLSGGSAWFAVIDVGTDGSNPNNLESIVVTLVDTSMSLFTDGFESGDVSRWSSSVP